ncbi:zinc ribbon domain-containing protein [Dialister invisus]|uniref:zinc ribbon domain-containing protein n=1 Tax=Dialister invisus TaxID=218538 RepID=UPI003522EACD
MFCTNCGKELPENALFCPSCGKSLFLSPATSPVSSQTTPIADINQQNTMSSPLEPSPSAMNFATVKCQDSPQYPAQTVTMPVANQQPSVPSVITANIPIPPVNLSTPPLPHKNLWERFKENRHVDEPNLMQINFNDQNTLIALQQIMGSGYYYYLPRLQHIQATGTSKFNWYFHVFRASSCWI